MKLGKLPAREHAIQFKFGSYFDKSKLPTPPAYFGHHDLVKQWGMLANDRVACCVFAGAGHSTMMWRAEGGTPVAFDDASVLKSYSELTGFDPSNPASDQGSDMEDAAAYRRKTGILDADGQRHTIDSYVALARGDIDEIILATYLFGASGAGINLPSTAEQQFDAGHVWDVVPHARDRGGHYVPIVGVQRNTGHLLCVTWGRLHAMTPAFYKFYSDEAVAYVSTDPLKNNRSPEGYAIDALRADLRSL